LSGHSLASWVMDAGWCIFVAVVRGRRVMRLIAATQQPIFGLFELILRPL